MDQDQILKLLKQDQLIEIIEIQQKEYEELKNAVTKFIQKNFSPGQKSDREDYAQLVSCKDIWDLKKAIEKG